MSNWRGFKAAQRAYENATPYDNEVLCDCGEPVDSDDCDEDTCYDCRGYEQCGACDEWFPEGDMVKGYCEECVDAAKEDEGDE